MRLHPAYVVAELGQEPGGVLDGPHVRAVGAYAEGDRLRGPADPQPTRGGARGLGERAGVARGVEVAGHVAADGVVEDRAVQHGAGQRAGRAQRPPQVRVRGGRDPATLRLEAEETAHGAGDADRATSVATEPDRHHPRRDRHRRAAGRPSRRARAVPRVAGHPARGTLGVGERPELRHRRLAHDHRPGRPQPPHDLRVGRHRRAVALATEGRHRARDVDLLLDDDRYAVERTARLPRRQGVVARLGLRERLGTEHHRHRVEPRVERGDPVQGGLHHLHRTHLPRARATGGLGGVQEVQLGHGRDPSPADPAPPLVEQASASEPSSRPRDPAAHRRHDHEPPTDRAGGPARRQVPDRTSSATHSCSEPPGRVGHRGCGRSGAPPAGRGSAEAPPEEGGWAWPSSREERARGRVPTKGAPLAGRGSAEAPPEEAGWAWPSSREERARGLVPTKGAPPPTRGPHQRPRPTESPHPVEPAPSHPRTGAESARDLRPGSRPRPGAARRTDRRPRRPARRRRGRRGCRPRRSGRARAPAPGRRSPRWRGGGR